MKLNDASPQQHLMVIVGAGACIFLNVITYIKADKGEAAAMSNQPRVTASVDMATGAITTRETRYNNPKLSWFDSLFCRGMERSKSCSYRLLHPFVNDDPDFVSDDAPPKQNHVVYYRGNIGKNSSLSGTIESPEATAPDARILDAK